MHPFVSIIIVNFNGQHLLQECLSALSVLNYPKKKLEVILVDNNSSDDSVHFVLKNFPKVRVIQNEDNLGFTGGNRVGFEAAKGEYIVLLNSDVAVDKDWLSALVHSAEDPEVGIISSRLRYAIPFIELDIRSAAVPKSKVFHTIDHSPIGVLIEEIQCESAELTSLVYYKDGFYDKNEGEISSRRTRGDAAVLLPFPIQDENTYTITLHGLSSTEPVTTPVSLMVNGRRVRTLKLEPHQTTQIKLTITKKTVERSFIWLIQNAGNVILHNGYGKDRGSVVVTRDNEQREFYEQESEYFDRKAELLAACGASCLIKRKVIDSVGFLDGYYFMYYEDVEFCLRAWRASWKILYEPSSVAYHKHRATTGSAESAFFLNLVERNHLAFVATHFPFSTIVSEIISFLFRLGITFIKFNVFRFRDNEARTETWRKKWEGLWSAAHFLVRSSPRLAHNRQRIDALWPMNQKKLQEMLY